VGSLWNRSGMVERYADDLRADGAKAFFFQGGTTSPLTVFRDSGESSAHPIPVVADSNGRWPDVFVPYVTAYDFQVKSKDGVQLTFTLAVPNPNPVDVTVIIPPEQRVQTGMIHAELINTTKTGYVRLNGRTIGNAASPASERANGLNNLDSDTFPLFQYLYNNLPDSIATVSGGRTVSGAISDFNNNKTIVLPDSRGGTLVGLDDMGNTTLANAFAGLAFTIGSSIIPGSTVGINSNILTVAQMPPHLHQGTTGRHLGHQHSTAVAGASGQGGVAGGAISTGVELRTDNGQFASHSHGWANGIPGDAGGFQTLSVAQTYGSDVTNHHHGQEGQTLGSGGGGSGWVGGSLSAGAKNTTDVGVDHVHNINIGGRTDGQNIQHFHTATWGGGTYTSTFVSNADASGAHDHTFSTDTRGGNHSGFPDSVTQPFTNMPLSRLVTWFIKL